MDKMENFENVQFSNGKVLMDLWDYNDLIRKCYMLHIIKDILYDSAILSYQKGALRFDDGIVSAFLRATDECRYKMEMKRLEDEKARKEAEDREKVID